MKLLKKSIALIVGALMTLPLLASCSAKQSEEKEPKIYTGSYEEKIKAVILNLVISTQQEIQQKFLLIPIMVKFMLV